MLNLIMRDLGGRWDRPSNSLGPMSRGTKWLVRPGCRCSYRYGGFTVPAESFPPWMDTVMATCMPLCGLSDASVWPNSCNVNYYTDGSEGIDWHADDEPLFQGQVQDCSIISLSLGQERHFEVRLNAQSAPLCRLSLRSGDLCTMEGHFQQHYQHRVPKGGRSVAGPRLNLTWRWIVAHDQRRCGL